MKRNIILAFLISLLFLIVPIIPVTLAQTEGNATNETTVEENVTIEDVLPDAILATTINYPDSLVAGVVAEIFGIPIYLTKPNVTDDLISEFKEKGYKLIAIIGGPAVISIEGEEKLKNEGFEVVRLWGATRYGTAAEVAKYFWADGVSEAVIASDVTGAPLGHYYKTVSLAQKIATDKEIPLLYVNPAHIPAPTLETIDELNITKLYVVGIVTPGLKAELDNLEIEYEIIANPLEEVARKILAKLKKVRVIVTRNPIFSNLAAYGKLPVFVISDLNETEKLINLLKEHSISNITLICTLEEGCDEFVNAFRNANITVTPLGVKRERKMVEEMKKFVMERIDELRRVRMLMRERFKVKAIKIARRFREKLLDELMELGIANETLLEEIKAGNLTMNDVKELLEKLKKLKIEQKEFLEEEVKEEEKSASEVGEKIKKAIEECLKHVPEAKRRMIRRKVQEAMRRGVPKIAIMRKLMRECHELMIKQKRPVVPPAIGKVIREEIRRIVREEVERILREKIRIWRWRHRGGEETNWTPGGGGWGPENMTGGMHNMSSMTS